MGYAVSYISDGTNWFRITSFIDGGIGLATGRGVFGGGYVGSLNNTNVLYNNTTTYVYPDGTKSVHKPLDGETFTEIGSDGFSINRIWQWDDFRGKWYDVTHGKLNEYSSAIDFECSKLLSDILKCECGSESVGSSRHSTWCKKYTA